ncbi:2-hydroxyacid dehydrogenase [Rudaeicoccus suwonensis]
MAIVSVPQQNWAHELADIDGCEFVVWDFKSDPPRRDIDVVVPPYLSKPTILARLADVPGLRAVQLVTAGYEHALHYLPPGVQLANGHGIHDTSTAELAVTLALASQRGIPQAVHAQDDGDWLRMAGRPSLADRRCLIIGYGAIGHAIARRLLAFEAHVTAVASRARAGDELVESVHGIDELATLLPDAEVVFLIVPLTDATRGLVNAEFLAALPDDALVVNVARGGVVDTEALIAACASGRVRAALDVTDPEPLPADHPLWHTPGVLVTPHVGGASTAFEPRALALLRRELTAFAAGEELRHVVAVGGE